MSAVPARSTVPPADGGRLIVALDVPDPEAARALVARLAGLPLTFKIGLELIYADGLPVARELIAAGHSVFLDAKLLDIPNTVERAVVAATRLGAAFLTVHGADRKTLDAALRGRGDAATKLLAITVLTSLDAADLLAQGIAASPEELVLRRARLAAEVGFDGVVASPREARAIRAAIGDRLLIVTPGIRPAGTAAADQARTATPAEALRAGADYLVVGRPITGVADPLGAAQSILAEMAAAAV
jgi:orotidine-5'-phosphate decarboxylase